MKFQFRYYIVGDFEVAKFEVLQYREVALCRLEEFIEIGRSSRKGDPTHTSATLECGKYASNLFQVGLQV